MKILQKNIKDLRADPNQPRKNIAPQQIEELAVSLKNRGLINPIEIDTKNVIVTGQMRWEAAKLLGWEKIPCRVIDIDGGDKFLRQVHENIHNNSMTAWDTANALQTCANIIQKLSVPGKLKSRRGGKRYEVMVEEVSKEIGRSKSYVSQHLSLLRETKEIREAAKSRDFKRTKIREANKAPLKYRTKLKKKVLKEDPPRIAITKLAQHLHHATPEQAKELLKTNYSGMNELRAVDTIRKIAPGEAEIIQNVQDKADHTLRLINQLSDNLSSYPLAIFDSDSSKMLIVSLSLFMKNIYRYIHSKPIEIPYKIEEHKTKK